MKPTRRNALTAAGLGIAAFAASAKAADWTPAEKANVAAVTAFCGGGAPASMVCRYGDRFRLSGSP